MDLKHFEGKTVGELLEYLHTQYGCYTKYDITPNMALGTLDIYRFLYYDSTEIKDVGIIVKPYHLKYLPQQVSFDRLANEPIDHIFPLYQFKKEKIDKISIKIVSLQQQLQWEKYLDSMRYESMKRQVEKELLLQSSGIKWDSLKNN